MVPAVTSSQRALTLGFLTPPPHFILQPGGFLLLLIAGLPGGSLFGFSLFLFIYFWLHWVSVAALGLRVPSLAAESGGCSWWWCVLLTAVSCLVAELRLRVCGLSSCAWALLPRGMWGLPGSGMESVSPALAGGFLITGPPGKSCLVFRPLQNITSFCIKFPVLGRRCGRCFSDQTLAHKASWLLPVVLQ